MPWPVRDVVLCADAREALAGLADASVDAVVTDPPAGIGFMGKEWDTPGALFERKPNTALAWDRVGGNHHACNASDRVRTARSEGTKYRAALTPIFAECVRVLKPGHQALVWALPRTSHWTATALEDAGFYVADVITHHFGSGFPKSRSLLKPATEHWILCRAPGPRQELNIDGCRVCTGESTRRSGPQPFSVKGIRSDNGRSAPGQRDVTGSTAGRWPSNLVLSHHPGCRPAGVRRVRGSNVPGPRGQAGRRENAWGWRAAPVQVYTDADGREQVQSWECVPQCPFRLLDEQAGECPSKLGGSSPKCGFWGLAGGCAGIRRDDTGGPSRFFPTFAPEPEDADWVPFRYCAKASRSERQAGCADLPYERPGVLADDTYVRPADGKAGDTRRTIRGNTHPTVKPLGLMSWLVKLVTPPGGLVLDPFCGSGSTLVACVREGMRFIGIDSCEEYVSIAQARVAYEQQRQTGPLFAGVSAAGGAV